MIHFFPTFSKGAKNSPFAKELAALGVPHRLFPGEVILRYHARIWLLLLGWPKVTKFAISSAIRSLILSKPYPDTVVVGSHIEVIIFGIFRALLFRKRPNIVLLGFIFTHRPQPLANWLRGLYFRFVFSIADQAICHSSLEVERYKEIFKSSRTRFEYIPYGLHISVDADPSEEQRTLEKKNFPDAGDYILSAGRSGRDYATLFKAVAPLPIALHVVCDSEFALSGLEVPANVLLLRNCYDKAYVQELKNALFVVIPLQVNDISAGQMVLIQAMAFSKPAIITRTPTVEEYVTEGVDSILVKRGDVVELREAIQRLLSDQGFKEKLGAHANATYKSKFCMKAYVTNLIGALQKP
ncbi:glycosyltransferase family 4 protein [Ferrovum myxofaciens]|uniref:glycosyltransferase family 4 protein n=1 Tax=Ferrovum myxofaciens TaxID=416213 RepID=UPI003EBAF3A0